VGAIDGVCYHFGAPLDAAPIEQVAGHACLVCPWHRYPLALDTGESFVQPGGASKGVKQRVHECRVEAASNQVMVRLGREPARGRLRSLCNNGSCSMWWQAGARRRTARKDRFRFTRAWRPAPSERDGSGRFDCMELCAQRTQFIESSLWLIAIGMERQVVGAAVGAPHRCRV
jgi:nitrite reductase/ring-hydroxylating ferredoxin subunit